MKYILKIIVLKVLHAYYRVRMSRPVVYMLNLRSKRQFERSKPHLSPADSIIVDEVRKNGCAVRFLVDFFTQEKILAIEAQALERRNVLSTDPEFERPANFVGKAFLRRMSELDNRFTLDDPLINFVVRGRANNIARHYLGQEVKISNIDYWLNLPSANGEGPISSQKWHRDFEDRRVFKVFVYLTDVDDSSGPLSYLPGSQPGGRYESIFPTRPPLGVVVEEEQLSGFIDSTELHTFRLPRLAIVFVDTAGLHKGGYCKSGLRFAFTATFTTFAGLSSKNFIIDGLGSQN
jgi:hypothetical protein